jgi:hypothetical protein
MPNSAHSFFVTSGIAQKLVSGIVGISTYVDSACQKEMQITARAARGNNGPINQLRTLTATLDFDLLVANLPGVTRRSGLVCAATRPRRAGRAIASSVRATTQA